MINDLISRDALKKYITEIVEIEEKIDKKWAMGLNYSLKLIDNAPSVESYQGEECVNIKMSEDEIKQFKKLLQKPPLFVDTAQVLAYESGKASAERPQGDWIPVSERLPEDMQEVLVWFEYYRYGDYNCMYPTYGLCHVLDGKWSPFINGRTGWQDARIIAWCPVPKPYKEAENDS